VIGVRPALQTAKPFARIESTSRTPPSTTHPAMPIRLARRVDKPPNHRGIAPAATVEHRDIAGFADAVQITIGEQRCAGAAIVGARIATLGYVAHGDRRSHDAPTVGHRLLHVCRHRSADPELVQRVRHRRAQVGQRGEAFDHIRVGTSDPDCAYPSLVDQAE
jgi:hypothetical protein